MPYQMINDIPVWGVDVDESAVRQMENCLVGARRGALMADHHQGYSQPIGGVAAYEGYVSVSGVGYDIACGNKAVRLDMTGDDLRENVVTYLDRIFKDLDFGLGEGRNRQADDPLFDDALWDETPCAEKKKKAIAQLGSIGSGNHYVDLFTDEADGVWAGVHCGSRHFGHSIATYFLKQAQAPRGIFAPPCLLKVGTPLADAYLACMELAGRYAYAGRDAICGRVAQLLECEILEEVHNHHNFAWKEKHDQRELWVIRKGATPAWPGQRCFVGGSMGDISVILEGVDNTESRLALHSAPHGAGRVMSRSAAKGKRKGKRVIRKGLVNDHDMRQWLKDSGVTLRGGGLDEAPQAYRRLPEVLDQHAGYLKIIHTLKPVGVCMASGR